MYEPIWSSTAKLCTAPGASRVTPDDARDLAVQEHKLWVCADGTLKMSALACVRSSCGLHR